MFKITFSNSKIFDNLMMNGSYYLTDEPIGPVTFEGGLDKVIIEDKEAKITTTLIDAKLTSLCQLDDKGAFALE